MAPQRSDVGFEVLWLGQAAKQIICTADTTSAGGKNGNDVDISLLLTNLPKCVDKPAHMREKGGGDWVRVGGSASTMSLGPTSTFTRHCQVCHLLQLDLHQTVQHAPAYNLISTSTLCMDE